MTPEQIAEIDEAWRPGHASILAQLIKHGAHNLKEHPEPVIVHGCTVIPAATLKEAVRVVWFGVPALLAEVERLTAALTAVDQDAKEARMERDEAKAKAAELQEDHMFLEALDAAGVDNWDGYSYAHEIFEEWTGGERK